MVDEITGPSTSWLTLVLPVTTLMVLAGAIVWAVSVVGAPETVRHKKLVRARINDVEQIHFAIDRYYKEQGKLPARLKELDIENRILHDPQTGNLYGYAVLDSRNYPLTAAFAYQGNQKYDFSRDRNWKHPEGVHHFSFTVPDNLTMDRPGLQFGQPDPRN